MANNEMLIAFEKSVISGGLSAALSMFLAPGSKFHVSSLGGSYPTWVVSGTAGFASSIAVEAFNRYALPHIEPEEHLNRMESALLSAGVSGTSFVAAHYLANDNSVQSYGLPKMFAAGVASEVGSKYITNNFVRPFMMAN